MIDNLATHCFIEFFYRKGNKIINEHNSPLSIKQLNESYGLFDGCHEIAKEIYDNIKNKEFYDGNARMVSIPMKNEWIDTIDVLIYSDNNTSFAASYNPSSKLIHTTNGIQFCPLKLSVNINADNIIVYLMHELTHAYEDYNRRTKKQASITDKALSNGYFINKNLGAFDDDRKYLSYLLYYLTDFEVNAYLSQIKAELISCNKPFVNISQLVEYLKNTKAYLTYSVIEEYVEYFSNISDKGYQNQIMKWISQLSFLKFKSYKHFVKYIQKRFFTLKRKIDVFVPKIAYEYMDVGNRLNSNNDQLPKIEK